MVFGNGVKNIQAAAYNGARTVYEMPRWQMVATLDNNDLRGFVVFNSPGQAVTADSSTFR